MNSILWLRAVALYLALALAFAAVASADVRRIEAVGAVGAVEGDRRDPRAAAVAMALREAVNRVASEFLVDAVWSGAEETGGAPNGRAPAAAAVDLAKVLGKDVGPYTTRFKVIEDRGLGPALFIEDPKVTEEYVVVAEVFVDADRVRERLVAAGLLEELRSAGTTPTVRLVVQGLAVYPALVDVRELIVGPVGAESVVPLEFERGSATLEVATSMTGPQLVAAMEREAPPHLTIIPLGSTASELRIAVRWTPKPEELPPVEAGRPDSWKPASSAQRRR